MSRKVVAWVAILGIALNALWPLLAHAAPAGTHEFSVPVCSTNGTFYTTASNAAPKPVKAPPASSALPHCPFCLGVSDQVPALATTPVVVFLLALSGHAPVHVQAFVWTSFTHPYSHPRGPPVFS
jgi:hypothetical protein